MGQHERGTSKREQECQKGTYGKGGRPYTCDDPDDRFRQTQNSFHKQVNRCGWEFDTRSQDGRPCQTQGIRTCGEAILDLMEDSVNCENYQSLGTRQTSRALLGSTPKHPTPDGNVAAPRQFLTKPVGCPELAGPWSHREAAFGMRRARCRQVLVTAPADLKVRNRGDDYVGNSTLAGARCVLVDGCNRRSLCSVQCSSVVPSTIPRSHLEQRLVSAFCLCSHQLHQELGLRMFRCFRVLDWSVHFDDTPTPAVCGRGGRARTSPLKAPQCAVASSSSTVDRLATAGRPATTECSFQPALPEK